eukprot:4708824-Pleurochrysis_carterae.AAC.2
MLILRSKQVDVPDNREMQQEGGAHRWGPRRRDCAAPCRPSGQSSSLARSGCPSPVQKLICSTHSKAEAALRKQTWSGLDAEKRSARRSGQCQRQQPGHRPLPAHAAIQME